MKQATKQDAPSRAERERTHMWDILLVCGLLAVSLVACFIVRAASPVGTHVTVTVDGVTVATVPLGMDGEYPLNGGTNTLVVRGGEAYLIDSHCPDHRCERGTISRRGESLTCLPNRLQVRVVGEGEADFTVE